MCGRQGVQSPRRDQIPGFRIVHICIDVGSSLKILGNNRADRGEARPRISNQTPVGDREPFRLQNTSPTQRTRNPKVSPVSFRSEDTFRVFPICRITRNSKRANGTAGSVAGLRSRFPSRSSFAHTFPNRDEWRINKKRNTELNTLGVISGPSFGTICGSGSS